MIALTIKKEDYENYFNVGICWFRLKILNFDNHMIKFFFKSFPNFFVCILIIIFSYC